VDLDLPALRSGAGRAANVYLLAASADSLPFRDGSFDCVIFSEVLEHVPANVEEACVRELRRVIVAGGTLLFTTPHRGAFWWLDPLMAKTHARRIAARVRGRREPLKGHQHYRVEEVRRLLEPQFEVLLVERRACLLHPLAYWGHLVTARVGGSASLMKLWQAFIDADYLHEYGDAAYSVCMVARAR
jgi:SAM-dependent methyltransferase